LVGALLVGLSAAKAIAFARGIPLVGGHHMEGHILAVQLETPVPYPYLALAVSGGHTHLYRVDGIGRYRTLGRTLDDAAGEAFDKVAKLLGLSYPGGVQIDRLAATGNPRAIDFPRPLLHQDNLDFSFSGMKTAVLNFVKSQSTPLNDDLLRDLAASFQAAVVDVLCQKTLKAARLHGLERIVVAGGVACNSGLRSGFRTLGADAGVSVHFPSPALCGDNAAMLAVAGDAYLAAGRQSPLDLGLASWPRSGRIPCEAFHGVGGNQTWRRWSFIRQFKLNCCASSDCRRLPTSCKGLPSHLYRHDPDFGFQIALPSFRLLLKENKLATIIGVFITNPLTAPFIYAGI
jgi:N6-L-threonylcarbamoyladenine synthase